MNRYNSQLVYGSLIVVTGVIVAILSARPSRAIQYVVAAGIFLSALFAFITAAKAKGTEIPMKFNYYQGAEMLAYALVILLYASTPERFNFITFFFLLLFGLSEILFGFELMSYKTRIRSTVIVFRMIIGLLMAVGAIINFKIAIVNDSMALLSSGILLALGGFSFIWFAGVTEKLGEPY